MSDTPTPGLMPVSQADEGVTVDVPIAFYQWLTTIEKDVRVHDLTPHEVSSLLSVLTRHRQSASHETLADEQLARFGHHPEPAIDFCIEVEELESIAASAKLGLTGFDHEEDRATLAERIAKAMLFRVGADENCVVAKQALRKLEDSLRPQCCFCGGPSPNGDPCEACAEAEVERILRLRNEELLAETTPEDMAHARGFKEGLKIGLSALHTTAEAGRNAVLEEAARKAHDTLIEINPSNYDHNDVCEANAATVEAILILADALGETHGKSPAWWNARRLALRTEGGKQSSHTAGEGEIEHIAKALYEATVGPRPQYHWNDAGMEDETGGKDHYRKLARAALSATQSSHTDLSADTLFALIAHGDDEHRAWLKEAIEAANAGKPVPECQGSGRKEALIVELLEALRPFAREADRWIAHTPDETPLESVPIAQEGWDYNYTLGDLRRAKAVYDAAKTQGEG